MLRGARNTLVRHRPILFVEDSEAEDMANMKEGHQTQVMEYLSTLRFACINLVQSGVAESTSLLFVPIERMDAVRVLMQRIDWRLR